MSGVAAGTSAAAKARRIDPNADIKIIQEEPVIYYGACGIPYVIERLIGDFSKLIADQQRNLNTTTILISLKILVLLRLTPKINRLYRSAE